MANTIKVPRRKGGFNRQNALILVILLQMVVFCCGIALGVFPLKQLLDYCVLRPFPSCIVTSDVNSTESCPTLPNIQHGRYLGNCTHNTSLSTNQSCVFRCNFWYKHTIHSTHSACKDVVFQCLQHGDWETTVSCESSLGMFISYVVFVVTGATLCSVILILIGPQLYYIVPCYNTSNTYLYRMQLWMFALSYLTFHPTNFDMFAKMLVEDLIKHNNSKLLSTALSYHWVQDIWDSDHLKLFVTNSNKEAIGTLLQYPHLAQHSEESNVLSIFLQNAAHKACQPPDDVLDIIKLILESGHAVDQPHWNFCLAIDHAPVQVCQLLLEKGADVNSEHKNAMPSLFVAIQSRSLAKVSLLVRSGVRIKSWDNMTPFEYAVALDSNGKLLNFLNNHLQLPPENMTAIIKKYRGTSENKCSILAELIRMGLDSIYPEYICTSALTQSDEFNICPINLAQNNEAFYSVIKDKLPVLGGANRDEELDRWTRELRQYSQKFDSRTVCEKQTASKSLSERYKKARLYFESDKYAAELARIEHSVHKVLEGYSNALEIKFKFLKFIAEPAGSWSENTKVYLPNELDFTAVITSANQHFVVYNSVRSGHTPFRVDKSDNSAPTTHVVMKLKSESSQHPWKQCCSKNGYLDWWKWNRTFINALQDVSPVVTTDDCLHKDNSCIDRDSKIPRLRLRWHGQLFRELKITVDIAPVFHFGNKIVVAKLPHKFNESLLPLSFNHIETKIIKNFPNDIRKGYVLCKALCHPDICCIGKPERAIFIESVYTFDFIKSYLLKTSLFTLLQKFDISIQSEALHKDVYIKIAEIVFEELERCLLKGEMLPYYSADKSLTLFCCRHSLNLVPSAMRRCCQHRDITLWMCRNILRFIREAEDYPKESPLKIRKSAREICLKSCYCICPDLDGSWETHRNLPAQDAYDVMENDTISLHQEAYQFSTQPSKKLHRSISNGERNLDETDFSSTVSDPESPLMIEDNDACVTAMIHRQDHDTTYCEEVDETGEYETTM